MANRTSKQARDIKLAFAKALIISKPSMGKDAINKAIRKEYGSGLRRIDVARLKDATLLGRPKRSTGIKPIEQLLKEEVLPLSTETEKEFRVATIGFDTAFHMLRSAGFLPFEIKTLFTADGVSLMFGSKPFKAMIKSRRNMIREKRKKGWTNEEIITNIKQHYQLRDARGKPLTNPFDFLKKEYTPRPKKDKATIKKALSKDYEKRKQREAAIKVEKLYGRGHRTPVIVR